MSLVGVYNLMETGIDIPSDMMSPIETAIDELSKTARIIALRYHNPYRWTLEKEEIFAELQLEVVKAVDVYFTVKSYHEFLTIARSMLWNRMRELLSRVYGTHHKNEYTAYSLSEEFLENDDYCDDAFTVFLMFEFMDRLSDLARKVLKTVLDPDDRMQSALFDYISQRGKLYKRGAGIYRIPLPVIQAGIDENPKMVKKAYKEIREELKKERSTMTIGQGIDFSSKLVTWKEVTIYEKPLSYMRWMKNMLKGQCEFRGIYQEGWGRKEMIKAIREDDAKRGIPSDESLPIYNEGLESHLPNNGNGNSKEDKEKEPMKEKIEVKKSEDIEEDEDDGFGNVDDSDDEDDDFVSVSDIRKKHEKESNSKKESIDEKKEINKKSTVKEEAIQKNSVNIIAGFMDLLREGETLRIKKVGDDEWIVSLEKK